jgi:hypothetical protein
MKHDSPTIIAAFISLFLAATVFGQVSAEADLQKIADKFIPDGMVSAHQAVQGKFAESASKDSSGNIVVLYKKDAGGSKYEGLILTSQGSAAYDRHELSDPVSTWSMMEPTAIFFANADGDPENELFIIEECFTGIGPEGAKPFYRTRVYDWNGSDFIHLESLSEKIGNGNTATKVRNKLRQIAKTSKLQPTEMFQKVEFAPHNEKIAKAAAANEDWVKMPMQIVARLLGEFSDMRSRTTEMTAPTADGPDAITVIITNDGYLDDSVRGERFKYELKANDQGVWKFTSASKAWRCQPGRGSQNFTTVKCS